MREKVTLVCSVCLSRNYRVSKNRTEERLQLMKHCRSCNRHTLHKETK